MDINIFTTLGELVVLFVIIILFLIVVTFVLGIYTTHSGKLVFPSLLLFALNLTYHPIKSILKFLKVDDLIIDRLSIDFRNQLNKKSFEKLDAKDTILILPHCLRANNCPAKLGYSGLECIKCGKCSIGTFQEICDLKEIGIYVVPGSTFIKHVIKQRPFKGVIGVACPVDLNQAMTFLSDHITQGVYLLNDGCINTLVDEEEVVYLLNILNPKTEYKTNILQEK